MSEYIPEHIRASIDRFVKSGIKPGGFVSALLSNQDVALAVLMADDESMKHLKAIVRYLCNEIPARAWGSEYNFYTWIKEKRDEQANSDR
jgi:hypothetical protein